MKSLIHILLLLWLGFLCLPRQEGYAQSIVWEKQWGFAPGSEQIEKICTAQNGNFFALGYSTRYRKDTMGSTYYNYVLIKFNQNGDTLFMKKLNILSGGVCFIGHRFGDVYLAVVLTPTSWSSYCPVFFEFTEDGIILTTTYLIQYTNYFLGQAIRTPDGGLLFPGSGAPPGGNQSAFKFNFLNELEWATSYVPPVTIAGYASRVEPMANGHYLLSGIIGKRIYGFEIDSAGNEIGQKEFYQTPSNMFFDAGIASQLWRKRFFSFGTFDQNGTRKVAMFCHDSSGNKLWGGESNGRSGPFFINRELSLIHTGTEDQSKYVARISADSTQLWKVYLGTFTTNRANVYDLCFTSPDTGIAVGTYIFEQGNLGQQFWIAKIAGVGTAYDPTHPEDTVTVSAQEKLFRPKDSPILFPNPATDHIQFQKLTQETEVAIYSTKGEKLLEKTIQPNGSVPISQLPKGAYLYHLKMGERVFTGRFLKE